MAAVLATDSARIRSKSLTPPQWGLVAMLVISIGINYVDRGSLSVGQKDLMRDLSIDPARLGLLFGAFFWTYAPLQIASGWLADRWPVSVVLGAGYLLWSLAMMASGFAGGLASLLALRLVLGAGESVAYPSYSRILAASFLEEQRGLANSLIDAGSKAGPAIGVLVGGLLIGRFGWRPFFIGMGLTSLLWLLPWTWLSQRSKLLPAAGKPADNPAECPSLTCIVSDRSFWGTVVGLFSSNYAWYFMVFWLPPYFENERHLSHRDMSILGSIPFWGVAAVSIACGWISDRFIARGASPNLVRKWFTVSGLLLSALIVPAMLIRDNNVSLAFLTIACASFGIYSSNVWAVTQTLAGPLAAGKWTGVQNAIGNVPGMLGLWFTGWVIQRTGHYLVAFSIASGFLVLGAVSYLWIIPRVEPVDWKKATLP
jgi:ACS family D-galactonate transporter-like MFS transporter